jgi:hypothetical protein
MRPLRLALLLAFAASAPAEAQPALGWAAADTLFAHFEDRFVSVPADPPAEGQRRGAMASFEVEYVNFPAQAREAVQYAVDVWAQHLESSVPIRVRARWEPAEDDVLGATSPRVIANFAQAPERDVWYAVALANARAGRDLDTAEPHIRMSFNSAFGRWYFGTDARPPTGRFDLATIALHELAHGLGFVGSMAVENGLGDWGLGERRYPVVFDRFAERGDGTPLTDEAAFPRPSVALAAALQSEDVFFDGPAALRADGGNRPRLHAPPTWEPGSSYAHLSERRVGGAEPYPPGSPNSLMTPTVGSAEAMHDPGPIVCGMFEDMGWVLGVGCSAEVPPDPAQPVPALTVRAPYPNPWRQESGAATVALAASRAQRVEVYLFDALGRRVASLFEGTLGEGEQRSVQVSGRLAAGVYFVWVRGPEGVETRPLTVLR